MKNMSVRCFQWLVIISFVSGMLFGLIDMFYENPTFKQVADYTNKISDPGWISSGEDVTTRLAVMTVISAIVFVVVIFIYVGLYSFQSWARHAFTASQLILITLSLFEDVDVLTGLSSGLFTLLTTFDGFLIGVMYFSPIADHFETKATTSPVTPSFNETE